MVAGQADRRHGRPEAVLARHAQLPFEVEIRRGDEHVDAAARRRRERPRGALDILGVAAGERGDNGTLDLRGNRPNGLGIRLRRNRKPRLDDVDPKRPQLTGQRQLLVDPQRESGRLFAVAQGRIEDGEPVAGHRGSLLSTFVSVRRATSPIYSYLVKISLSYAAPRPGRLPRRRHRPEFLGSGPAAPPPAAGDQPGGPAD